MKISHKRKVQLKLQKHIKAAKAAVKKEVQLKAPKAVKPAVETKVKAAPKAEAAPKVVAEVALTPKQQQVLDIVRQNAEGINPKGIGLAAGQEESKAASWATAALKKLAEEGVVERIQQGSKVLYKAL